MIFCCSCSDLAGGADLKPMSLGLSHSLSRYKLKFSPEKVLQLPANPLQSSHHEQLWALMTCLHAAI
jgi:hypothetical protein